MNPSLSDVYNASLRLQDKAVKTAELYRAYYGKFSPNLTRNMYDRINESQGLLQEVKTRLAEEGFDSDGLGFPFLFVIAAALVATAGFGYLSLREWAGVKLAEIELKEKTLDAVQKAGLEEAYIIDNAEAAPPSARDIATGFGFGTIAALALGVWLLTGKGAR